MTAYKDLLYSILAMDSYNREYGEGVKVAGDKIGSATFIPHNEYDISEPQFLAWQAAGFYAAAYQLPDGEVVISYRGTKPPPSPCKQERMKTFRHALAGDASSSLLGRA
jgi:hypothetical protein